MELTFLGTASCYPTPTRGVSCIGLRCMADGAIWLFDCGEGSQTQLMKSHLKAGKVRKIFITHLHGDHVFGLPGLLCTLSQQKAEEKSGDSDACAVEIYGPQGLRNLLATSLSLSGSALGFPYVVHEILEDCPVGHEDPVDREAPLRQQKQPDDVDDVGIVMRKCAAIVSSQDIPLLPNEKLGTRFSFQDYTSVTLISPPSFPSSTSSSSSSSAFRVRAAPLRHRIFSLGYVIEESNFGGRLDVALLKSRGIRPGPLYGKIKAGEDIVCPDGSTLKACDAVGREKRGRKIVILGDTCDSRLISDLAMDADVIIHEVTLEDSLRDQAVAHGHSTPSMATKFARDLNSKKLILTHFSQRYKDVDACLTEEDKLCCVEKLLEEGKEELRRGGGDIGMEIELAADLKLFSISAPS